MCPDGESYETYPPPRKVRAWLGVIASLYLSLAGAAQAETLEPFCQGCPTPVAVPENYTFDQTCGDIGDLMESKTEWGPTVKSNPLTGSILDLGPFLSGWGNPAIVEACYDDGAEMKCYPSARRFGEYRTRWTYRRAKPGVLNLTKVQLKSRHDWSDGPWNELGRWYYFSKAQVDYTVTCKNGITYAGSTEFEHKGKDACYAEPFNSCLRQDFDYQDVGLEGYLSNRPVLGTAPHMAYSSVLDEYNLLAGTWAGRTVGYPRYYGGTNRLAVPVVMINGLGYDYRSWGAVPAGVAGTEAWRKGLVKDYTMGSLPDIMSRAYGLSKGEEINRNGLYFLNLDPKFDFSSTQEPQWFVERLGEMITDYAGSASNVSGGLQVDLVCHSSGCLLLREILARAGEFPAVNGVQPLNHIRRIVSVNAPHEGTGLGKSSSELSGFSEYKGLPALMRQIEQPNASEPVLSGKVKLDLSEFGWRNCPSGGLDAACWVLGQHVDFTEAALSSILTGYFLIQQDLDEINLNVTGGLFGPHKAYANWPVPGMSRSKAIEKPELQTMGKQMAVMRAAGTDVQSLWLQNRASADYPRKPNGQYYEFVPFYSDRADRIETGIMRELSDGAFSNMCDPNGSADCAPLQAVATTLARAKLEEVIEDKVGGALEGTSTGGAVSLTIAPSFRTMLSDLQQGWLYHSDLVVEKSSQIWGLGSGKQDDNGQKIDQLHKAMTYDLHYGSVPEGHPNRPVIHGPMNNLAGTSQTSPNLAFLDQGATLQGLDLFCGLDDACRDLTGRGRPRIYMGAAVQAMMPRLNAAGVMETKQVYTQVAKLTGDFQVYPMILSPEFAGVALQDANGNNVAVAGYDPIEGTWIWTAGANGGTVTKIADAAHRGQFTVVRTGSLVEIVVTPQMGQPIRTTVSTAWTAAQTNLVVMGDGLATNPAILIGEATPVNPELAKPLQPWGTVRPLVQEHGKPEVNQSRPWLWVGNRSDVIQKNLKVTYFFTADPSRKPVVEMDHPRDLKVEQRSLGGDLWAFTVTVPTVAAQSVFPKEGMQIRLHYGDWTAWTSTDDPSVGVSVPLPTDKVLIHDAQGRLIWGDEQLAKRLETPAVAPVVPVAKPVVYASWADAGAANWITPNVTISNATSSAALASGFKVVVLLTGVNNRPGLPVLEKWWDPNATGTISREADGRLRLEWTFNRMLAKGQEIKLGQWGIHWPKDYPAFTKDLIQAQWQVLDADGAVLYQSPL